MVQVTLQYERMTLVFGNDDVYDVDVNNDAYDDNFGRSGDCVAL